MDAKTKEPALCRVRARGTIWKLLSLVADPQNAHAPIGAAIIQTVGIAIAGGLAKRHAANLAGLMRPGKPLGIVYFVVCDAVRW